MSINLTDEIEVKTKKGKLGAAKQIFLEGDTTSLQKEHEDNQAHFDTLDNRSAQMEETIKSIAATGGASQATAVTYNNDASRLNAVNAQAAIDEVSSIAHFAKRGGIVNISTNYNSTNTAEVLTLPQVLSKVPSTDRVLGFQGKYLATDGWHTIIYIGDSLTDWSDTTKWIDSADKVFNSISKNATFAGIATPTTNPDTPDGPVFYIANGKGTYTNFGDIVVIEDEVVILYYDTVWHKETTGIASNDKLTELGLKVIYGEKTQIQGTLESGYCGEIGRNTQGYVKVFNVSGINSLVHVTTNTNNPYVVLWVLSAVQVNVGDNYSKILAHSGLTSDINNDTIDLSLYPTAKYLYVANFDNTDISSAYTRAGGFIGINEHISSLDDAVSRINDSLANINENVDSLDETINGQERTIETIIQSVSTVTKARIDNALRRVYLSVYNSTLAVKFYPIVQGGKYSIHIPKMLNEYSCYWGYTNNYPTSGELTEGWDSVNGLIADTTTGDGEKTINITSAANYGYIAVCYDTTGGDPTVKQYEVIIENGIKQDIERLISEEDTVSVNLPDKIFAVVGDKFQLFYRGIIKAIDPYKYDIVVSCSKGNSFPRYYELTPTISETLDFSISVKNAKGTILAEGSTQIVCKNAISPRTSKNILCFGDSLTSGGEWVNEANRRLTLDTVVDGIAGSNLNNIVFCGSKTTENGAGYFGVGGWSWETYMSQGVTMYRTNVSNVSSCQVGAVYRVNGYLYEVIEVNITAGIGMILLSKFSSYSQPAPPASGTLVKVGGYGDSEISYSSYVEETYSPLWNNGSADFINYAHENANDQIDVVVTLLTWNDGSGRNDFNNFDSDRKYMTLFGNTLHSQFPTAKWLLLGIQLPSINGGIGQNNGANDVTAWGVTKSVFNKNDFYQEFANDDSFKSFTKFINISSQFDSENNMQEAAVRVNTRNTKTEERGTNAVHPALSGYMQIADIVFRSIIGELS